MDALVVNPPTLSDIARVGLAGRLSYFEFEKQTAGDHGFLSFPGEHLGLMALVAACRAVGLRAVAVNGQVRNHRTLDQTWQAMTAAAPSAPAVVGFSGPCQVLKENMTLAHRVREHWPDTRIVMGHDFATLNFRRLLADCDVLDAVVLGEGEASFPELVRAVLEGRPLEDVPGVATRATAQPRVRAPLELDSLPWVARDDLAPVLAMGMSAAVFSGRGCPFRCSFCTTGQTAALLPKRATHRQRAVEDVVDEIQKLCTDHAVQHLTIVDDLFVTERPESQERARRFAEALQRRAVRVPFMLDARVDSIEAGTFAALRKAGLHRVFVGVETGSRKQLASYGKGYVGSKRDPQYVRKQMRVLRELEIEVVPGIITYHPETEPEELMETLEAIDACGYRGVFQFFNRVFAHPGTSLWTSYLERGLLREDWPVPAWDFRQERASVVESRVLAAIARGAGFDDVRTVFEREIQAWLAEGFTPARRALPIAPNESLP